MYLTKIAVNRPVTTFMLSLALIFLGIVSFRELQVQMLPDVSFPFLYYSARIPDTDISPEQTNDELTRPIEKMVASLSGVKDMHSNTYGGYFWGYAEFERGTDMRFRVIEIQDKVNKWVSEQNKKIDTWIVPESTSDLGKRLMRLTLTIPLGQEFQTASCTDLIKRRIKSIDGISMVEISGEMYPRIILETEQDQLQAKGLNVQQLVNAIDDRQKEKELLGMLKDDQTSHGVYLNSHVDTMEELLDIPVDDVGVYTIGRIVNPVSKVERSERIFRINGKKAIGVRISKEKDANTIRIARLLRDRIDEINSELPDGFELLIIRDESESLERLIKNILKLASLGAFLAMLVLVVFVRSWRIALVVAISIPASIIITFNAMYAADLSINILSLLGLAAGIGMLVDNAIVVVENVFRHAKRSIDNKEAAYDGSREVARAILITTITTVVVFVPLVFFDDMMVIVMQEMSLSFIFPLAISLLIALTLIPMLTSKVIGGKKWRKKRKRILSEDSVLVKWNPWQKPDRPVRNLLREFILFCTKSSLRHPVRLLFVIVIILLFSSICASIKIAIQNTLGQEKMREFTIYGKTPIGFTLEEADEFFMEKENELAKMMEETDIVESFTVNFSKTGGTIDINIAEDYQRYPESELAQAFRFLKSVENNSGFAFRPFKDVVTERPDIVGWGTRSRFEKVEVLGDNYEAMLSTAKEIETLLKNNPEVEEADFDTPLGAPEIHFVPDMELFKVMKADPSSLRTFFQSRENKGISTSLILDEDGIERKVTVKVLSEKEEEKERIKQTLSELKKMKVSLLDGGVADLDHLGTFSIHHAIPFISKNNRQRNLNVSFDFREVFRKPGMEKKRQEELNKIRSEIMDLRFPPGISFRMGGTLEDVKSQKSIWKKLIWSAVLAVYLVMAFFMESLILPIVILLTIPLAAIGAIWGIILFKTTLDEVSMFGTVILAGLVVNNGILLIEYARQMEKQKNFNRARALVLGVSYRLRPILMTSLTTILGLWPILFSVEAEKEARSLVSVIIGGIVVSALLSLVVVPTFYNVLYFWLDKLQVLKNRMKGKIFKILKGSLSQLSFSDSEMPVLTQDNLHISIERITKIYPVFTKEQLLNFIPSRMHSYGCRPRVGTTALKEVSLSIGPGMFGLLGPNGAGKTTLMKIITGLVPSTFGVIEVGGYDLRYYRHNIRSMISYLPQNFGVYESLNLYQYLSFFASYYGINDTEERDRKIEEAIKSVGLEYTWDKPMKRFSGGMKQRAGIAQFLLGPCPIIIVDEPTAGLDPVERVRFRLLLSQLARTRIVIISTHIVDDITSSCKRVAVLNHGRIIYEGNLDSIKTSAKDLVWDLTRPADERMNIPDKNILFRKHLGNDILYHYISSDPIPGSVPIEATFEDAYVALLLKHDEQLKSKVDDVYKRSSQHLSTYGESPEFSQ